MVQKRYSEILADILTNKHSKCTCPPEYFSSKQITKPKVETECCQFGPDCQFLGSCSGNGPVAVACQYNQAKCTCNVQCICGPQAQLPVQLLQGPELDQVIDTQMCICGGNCFCESEDRLVCRPTSNCDKTKCICSVCMCRPDASDSRLLPADFRNTIKKEPQVTTDDRIKQECAEIKQLLIEHEESKKRELEESSNLVSDKNNKKPGLVPLVSITDDHGAQAPQSENKDAIRESVTPQEESLQVSARNIPKESVASARSKKKDVTRKEEQKKKKTPKQKSRRIKSAAIQLKPTTPSQFTQYSCGCRMPKKKPLHMRYYFSGGTEHYGVKQGHKQCLPKPALVPKNMGWLWNIEDPSKGIRERKGWPPGFIAKNIKNMIKVLKQFEDTSDPSPKLTSHAASGVRRFGFRRREEGEVGAEPQEEPPLLHIHKKGRTYNITFCPKSSDTDIGPIPIPFSITEKRQEGDSSSSDSTLEFEFHSPKPKLPQQQTGPKDQEDKAPDEETEPAETTVPPPSTNPTTKIAKKKPNKKRSLKSTEENKNLWEEQQTQIENIT